VNPAPAPAVDRLPASGSVNGGNGGAWFALVYPGELPSTAVGVSGAAGGGVAYTLDALYPVAYAIPAVRAGLN
jgi:hypothetical protein